MATSQEYADYICERLPDCGTVRCRKMFGEYMIYVNEKPLLLVCDNTVFVKKLPELNQAMADAPTGSPYPGAKEHYILDIDDGPLVARVIAILEPITPVPIKRKKG